MKFKTEDVLKAMISLQQFRAYSASPHHERYSFPFLQVHILHIEKLT